MILKNRFSEEDKMRVWIDHQYCAECNSNEGCALHHIKSTESDSILNSIMLCHKHHSIADGHNKSDIEYISKYLKYSIKQALKSGYILKEKDFLFYKNNEKYYD